MSFLPAVRREIQSRQPNDPVRLTLEYLLQRGVGRDKRKSNDTLAFSNEIGEPLPHFHDTRVRTVLKAHGITPRWSATHNYKGLSPECKAAYRKIDLRWHDIRHEYASQLVEKNVPLAQVRDLLGHASITTPERYDNETRHAAQESPAHRTPSNSRNARRGTDGMPNRPPTVLGEIFLGVSFFSSVTTRASVPACFTTTAFASSRS